MARSPIRPLAIRRRSLTGETYQQAHRALSELLPGTAPIPAATPDLAALEALVLDRIGSCDLDLWHPGVLPFEITSITPRPDRLTMRVPRAFLPDIIRQIMPTITDEHGEPNVGGVIGLRVTPKRGIARLRRPGLPGLIEIPATRSDWDRAVKIATDGWAEGVNPAWLTHPNRWHPGELALLEAYPDHYAPGGEQYRKSAFASAVLRRLPGMCPHPETTEYHNLWINMWPDHGYHVFAAMGLVSGARACVICSGGIAGGPPSRSRNGTTRVSPGPVRRLRRVTATCRGACSPLPQNAARGRRDAGRAARRRCPSSPPG